MPMTLEDLGFSQGHRKKLLVDEQILNSGQMFPDTSISWQKIDKIYNQVSLYKTAQSVTGNALNVIDHSNDNNASVYIEYSGNSAGKDLVHVEMTTAMTECRAGISVEQEGGTASALITSHAKTGTITNVAYFENDCSAGKGLFVWNDNASNTDPVAYFRADGVVSTNYYKILGLDADGSHQTAIWVANNADPNGNLSGSAGDLCLSTNGNIYRCTGTTNWTAM